MMTVHQVSELTGVSIRTLQYYDKIGLLPPASHSEAGYRLYDDNDLARLQEVLLFKELEFPLKEIIAILNDPSHSKEKALEQQTELLKLKKEHLEGLIRLAERLSDPHTDTADFSAFDTKKLDEYTAQAKAYWGGTNEYKEFEGRDKDRSDSDRRQLAEQMMDIFVRIGKHKSLSPGSCEVQELAAELQSFITEHYYHCSDKVFEGLGKMYGAGGDFTHNINTAAGDGTAEFASKAIEIYCRNRADTKQYSENGKEE